MLENTFEVNENENTTLMKTIIYEMHLKYCSEGNLQL